MALTTQTAIADCQEALSKCDKVIEKQGDLIVLMKARLDEQVEENDRLSKAVVSLSRDADKSFQSKITYGVLGFALGVIAISAVK